MNIDERLWPLPNAFSIREGSPFGKSEKLIKEQEQARKATLGGQRARTKTPDTRTKTKAK
jgi:hypothetical protein